jgi:EF hand
MNYFCKTSLVFAILGLALHSKPVFAETSSGSSSTAGTQNPKTSADQSDAKASAGTGKSDAVKDSSVASKEDSVSPHLVAAPSGPALFKLLDTDKDGRISATEFIAYGNAARTADSAKTSPGADTRSDSPSGTSSSRPGTKSDGTTTTHSDKEPAATSEPASSDAGIPTSTDTRAGRYTADVFEILDINHDKFLSQAELDALFGAHPISQP